MKRSLLFSILIFVFLKFFAFSSSKINFYGELSSTFSSMHEKKYVYNDFGIYSWGVNNYENLRIKSTINEFLSFVISFNINTFSGNYTEQYKLYFEQAAFSMLIDPVKYKLVNNSYFSIPFYYKNSYIGSIDLERLYFTIRTKVMDLEMGLIRLAKGYSFFFKPLDIFNPVDPFHPDARPEGKIALKMIFYPSTMWTIDLFAILPDNPLEKKGWGFKFGTSTNFSFNRFNFELLYALFLPEVEYLKRPKELELPEYLNNDFSHLFGFAMKLDIEIGLITEISYRLEQRMIREKGYYGKPLYLYRGLDFTVGIDYTIPLGKSDSKLYFLVEYMFFGSGILDWDEKGLDKIYNTKNWIKKPPYERKEFLRDDILVKNFLRHDYTFILFRYIINTYISLSLNYLFGMDDQSSLLGWQIEIEPFQAFIINIMANYPLDWQIHNSTFLAGEFGATNSGYYQKYQITAKIKF